MKKHYDKIIVVLALGSFWGVLEIYGVQFLQMLSIPHKSPFLLAFAIMLMMTSKKLIDLKGSAFLMAIIAVLYKTLSFSLPACGSNAVMALLIDGAVFEISYEIAKSHLNKGILSRSISAALIAFTSCILFSVYAAFINPENTTRSSSFDSFLGYILSSGIYAAILTAISANIGFFMGSKAVRLSASDYFRKITESVRVSGMILVAFLWGIRLIF